MTALDARMDHLIALCREHERRGYEWIAGRVAAPPGSREPSPSVPAASGFEPSRGTCSGRVLVCGGRMYGRVADDTPPERLAAERARAQQERLHLYGVLLVHRPSFIIHGAANGADEWADYWAERNNVPHRAYPADWRRNGRAAGPIRNQRMLDDGKPDLVIAFTGGRGTADMVRRARAAGVRVLDLSDSKGGDAQ